MNPLVHWIISMATRKALSRKCPFCGRVNVVPQELLKRPIACNHCGKEIPPP